MSDFTLTVVVSLKHKVLIDLLTTAVQGGGSAYWANDYTGLSEDRNEECETIRFTIGKPSEDNLPEPMRNEITLESIQNAICWISQEAKNGLCRDSKLFQRIIKDIVENSDDDHGCASDADIADMVLQIAVFGEIIFG
jgi:hypothetical protein